MTWLKYSIRPTRVAAVEKGISRFKAAGICPLDPGKFSFDECQPATKFRTIPVIDAEDETVTELNLNLRQQNNSMGRRKNRNLGHRQSLFLRYRMNFNLDYRTNFSLGHWKHFNMRL
jgi:hypothetical protein